MMAKNAETCSIRQMNI